MDSSKPLQRLVVVGAGQLGRALLASFVESGRSAEGGVRAEWEPLALTRTEASADALRAEGWSARAVDLARGMDAELRARMQEADVAVFCAAPSGASTRDEVYRRIPETVAAALPKSAHLVYVSSTGVYAERDGGLVDEAAPLDDGERARPLRAGEEVAREAGATVLRCSGLIGPDRGPKRRRLDADEGPQRDRWLNLVWMDDVVKVLRWALRSRSAEVLNVSAPPQRRRDFYDQLHSALGRRPLDWVDDENQGYRVDASRLRAHSGIVPRAVAAAEVVQLSSSG